jgi:hypothetical protein
MKCDAGQDAIQHKDTQLTSTQQELFAPFVLCHYDFVGAAPFDQTTLILNTNLINFKHL